MREPETYTHVAVQVGRTTFAGSLTLEIGCGAGQYRRFVKGVYVGLDVTSAEYKMGITRNVDVLGVAEDLPFRDCSFDLVFAVASFYLFEDRAVALSEVRRVLRPSGALQLFDYNWRTIKRLEKQQAAPGGARHTQWGLAREVRKAGFTSVRILHPREAGGDHLNRLERVLRLARNEMRDGGWAIVTARKPGLLAEPGRFS